MSLDTQANVFVKATLIVKFRMCEYDIPCALEKIVMADLSALITWSSKITIIYYIMVLIDIMVLT